MGGWVDMGWRYVSKVRWTIFVFVSNVHYGRITQLPERGTGVASATTVDVSPWSDEKKQQENFTMFVWLGLLSSFGSARRGDSDF
jgi:hypothetical protein